LHNCSNKIVNIKSRWHNKAEYSWTNNINIPIENELGCLWRGSWCDRFPRNRPICANSIISGCSQYHKSTITNWFQNNYQSILKEVFLWPKSSKETMLSFYKVSFNNSLNPFIFSNQTAVENQGYLFMSLLYIIKFIHLYFYLV
jgi:hypothetical protein